MATDLGKVGIVMKGTWSSSAAYEVLDAVSYNTGLYIARQAVPAGTLPTNTTYWQNAIDAASFLDGVSFVHSTLTRTGNYFNFYMGNNTNLKISGDFNGYRGLILFCGHVNAGANPSYRGIYWLDANGNVVDMSNTGGTPPTASVNSAKTEMTVTLSSNNQFVLLITFHDYSVTIGS